ncbi:MAG: hypothetical protein IJW74_00180, partial [Oscillospiraceae bacterium]|nr:hypothetical protein [Oscillospiraceae bacterium]
LCEDDVQIRYADGNLVIAVYVPKAERKDRPVYIGGDVYSGSYIRKGEGDCRCSHDEVEKMLCKAKLYFD